MTPIIIILMLYVVLTRIQHIELIKTLTKPQPSKPFYSAVDVISLNILSSTPPTRLTVGVDNVQSITEVLANDIISYQVEYVNGQMYTYKNVAVSVRYNDSPTQPELLNG